MGRSTQLPDKLFFKIGEVSEIVGVKPHVLRYWESEFPALRPKKTRGSHRMYSRQDVELAMLIRRLVHDEGFTIPGARRQLRRRGQHKRESPPDPGAKREAALRAELVGLREELAGLLERLDGLADEEGEEEPTTVTVHRSVPRGDPW